MQKIAFRVKKFFRRDFPRKYHLEVRWKLFESASNEISAASVFNPGSSRE